VDTLVDTDLLFAVIPAPVLERLGVQPLERRYEGRRVAQVEAQLNGQAGHAMVTYGDAGATPRIGRHTLDTFVLDIDEDDRLVEKILRMVCHDGICHA
jgi:predicted aspartyl protease